MKGGARLAEGGAGIENRGGTGEVATTGGTPVVATVGVIDVGAREGDNENKGRSKMGGELSVSMGDCATDSGLVLAS